MQEYPPCQFAWQSKAFSINRATGSNFMKKGKYDPKSTYSHKDVLFLFIHWTYSLLYLFANGHRRSSRKCNCFSPQPFPHLCGRRLWGQACRKWELTGQNQGCGQTPEWPAVSGTPWAGPACRKCRGFWARSSASPEAWFSEKVLCQRRKMQTQPEGTPRQEIRGCEESNDCRPE